ncbi:hypothetical protein GW916_06205 [bacterium]|nr:hypothetical protein [bacterium]
MKASLSILSLILFGSLASAKVKIENVKVVVTEKGKEPVKITMPYWVAKGGAEISDQLKVGSDEIPMKKIIQIIDKAPKLGDVMTIEEGAKKIVVSIE